MTKTKAGSIALTNSRPGKIFALGPRPRPRTVRTPRNVSRAREPSIRNNDSGVVTRISPGSRA